MVKESKTYVAQNRKIKQEIAKANRSGDTSELETLTAQSNELVTKLNVYTEDLALYRKQLDEMVTSLNQYREQERTRNTEIRELYLEIRNMHSEIIKDITLKNEKWVEFRAAVGEKNYGKAIEAFNAIIERKTAILDNLKAKNVKLTELIAMYSA